MKVKYSGTPFHHFKCGIIMPGIIELDDEWARRLIEAGIVEQVGQAPSPVDKNNIGAVREPPLQKKMATDVGAGSPRPPVCAGRGQGNPAPTGFGIELPDYHEAEDVGDPITVYIENERRLHEDYITDPRRNDTGDEPRKRKRGK